MSQTTVYTRGVKYIKIAKQDSGSVDNSSMLQNLTDIRIQFSDITAPVQYNVTSINEYSTYYLYSIAPTDITSSADQEILNYRVSGSSTSGVAVGTTIIRPTNYTISSSTNTLNYFTASSGIYTPGNTPNVILNVTSSIIGTTNGSGGISYLAQLDSNGLPISYIFSSSFTTSSLNNFNTTFSGSFTPVKGSNYGLVFFFQTLIGLTFTTNFNITQSVTPKSSNYDIVVMEPYVGENFYNSDCNVIQNNVDVNNVNPLYMDVDFTNSPIIAQNQVAILNGTATRAEVQPWNYSYYSNISGRYIGRQQNAIAINVYTSASQFITASAYGFTGSWPGDTTSPSIPVPGNIVIQSLDSCIYEFNWAGGGYAENSNGGFINMGNIYLVGETKDDVAIIKTDNPSYLDILAKMFPSGSTAYQYQYSTVSGLPTQLNITYPTLGLTDAKYYQPSNEAVIKFGIGTDIIQFFPTGSGSITNTPFIFIPTSSLDIIYSAVGSNNGYLQKDTTPPLPRYSGIITEISGGISNGEKWFVSLYSGSGTSTSLVTGLSSSVNGSNLSQYGGYMFEIASAYTSSDRGFITLKTGSGIYNIAPYFTGSTSLTMGLVSTNATTGLLISKGNYPSNNLTIFGVPSLQFSGTGKGYILSPYPKKVITENIDYITKTYGNNPN